MVDSTAAGSSIYLTQFFFRLTSLASQQQQHVIILSTFIDTNSFICELQREDARVHS